MQTPWVFEQNDWWIFQTQAIAGLDDSRFRLLLISPDLGSSWLFRRTSKPPPDAGSLRTPSSHKEVAWPTRWRDRVRQWIVAGYRSFKVVRELPVRPNGLNWILLCSQ